MHRRGIGVTFLLAASACVAQPAAPAATVSPSAFTSAVAAIPTPSASASPTAAPPPHAVPAKGAPFFQAKLDATNSDIAGWGLTTPGTPANTELRYVPGAIELVAKAPGANGFGNLSMPRRSTFIGELDVAATTTNVPPGTLNFGWQLRNCGGRAGDGALLVWVQVAEETLQLLDDLGSTRGFDNLTAHIPIPSLKNGVTHTIAAAVSESKVSLFVDEQLVASVPYARCTIPSRSLVSISSSDGGTGVVRITGARFYELPPVGVGAPSPVPTARASSLPSLPSLVPAPVAGCPADSLRAAATARGFAIGMGGLGARFVNMYPIRDARARETLRCAATLVTFNAFYWGNTEYERGKFTFDVGDDDVAWAAANGIPVRGHTLVWHQVLPPWLENGTFTADELKAILKNHIQTVVAHYRGRVLAWDVLNEAIDDRGLLRPTVWQRTIGPEFIELAFRWAHEADPQALLFYNDADNEGAGPRADAQYALLRDLRAKGVPIDGVGFQMHLIQGREALYTEPYGQIAFAAMEANMRRLAALGLQIHITEMDVSIAKLDAANAPAQQAAIYAETLRVCLRVPQCTALVTWGLDDAHSWLIDYLHTESDAPLLFDRDLRPKPAIEEMRKVLLEAS